MTNFDDIFSRIMTALDATNAVEVANELGIKRQAIYTAKKRGKIPKTWVQKLRDEHDLSPDWVLTGQGERRIAGGADGTTRMIYPPTRRPGIIHRAGRITDPDSSLVLSAAGKRVGDLLFDIIAGRLNMTQEEFASRCGLNAQQLDDIISSRKLPWKAMRAMAMLGVNLNFLLTEQWPDWFPTGQLGRAMWALGAEDSSAFAQLIDARYKDVERVRMGEADMPYEWTRKCIESFGISPAWLSEGHLPTHMATKTSRLGENSTSRQSTRRTSTGLELEEIKTSLQEVGASEDEIKQALLDHVRGGRAPQDSATGTDDSG